MSRLKIFSLGLLVIGIIICLVGLGKNYFHNDSTKPVISMADDTVVISVKDDESAILEGVTATDERDGDVTDRLVVSSLTPFTDVEKAERVAVIAAFDSSNNIAFAKRTVTYSDYRPIEFTLSEPLRFSVGNTDSGAWTDEKGNFFLRANDCIDGDISSQIQYLGMDGVDSKEAGVYEFTVRVTNSAGDTVSFPLSVEYYDTRTAAPLVMLEDYMITIDAGDEPDLEGLITGVSFRGNELETDSSTDLAKGTFDEDDITIDDSHVKYNTPGVYEAVYEATYDSEKDDEDAETGTIRLVVIVR